MSNPGSLAAICWETEASWGEDQTTFATQRLALVGAVDASGLTHDKQAPDRVEQYRNA